MGLDECSDGQVTGNAIPPSRACDSLHPMRCCTHIKQICIYLGRSADHPTLQEVDHDVVHEYVQLRIHICQGYALFSACAGEFIFIGLSVDTIHRAAPQCSIGTRPSGRADHHHRTLNGGDVRPVHLPWQTR